MSDIPMAFVGDTPIAATAPQCSLGGIEPRAVATDVMRCLAVSTCGSRRNVWQMAAEQSGWEALVCRSGTEFLHSAQKLRVPLMLVDLPDQQGSSEYQELVAAVDRISSNSDALLAICGFARSSREEIWARSLGVWTYLNGVEGQTGMELLLNEARIAIGRRPAF